MFNIDRAKTVPPRPKRFDAIDHLNSNQIETQQGKAQMIETINLAPSRLFVMSLLTGQELLGQANPRRPWETLTVATVYELLNWDERMDTYYVRNLKTDKKFWVKTKYFIKVEESVTVGKVQKDIMKTSGGE